LYAWDEEFTGAAAVFDQYGGSERSGLNLSTLLSGRYALDH
jgi:hypothetical protein